MKAFHTVGVAQLVERWIVVPVAEGSNPSTHPNKTKKLIRIRRKGPRCYKEALAGESACPTIF
jgi:hypothetical protein